MQNTDTDKTITTKEHRVDPTAVPLSTSDNKSQIQGSSVTTVTSTLSVTSTAQLATSVETSVTTSVATATTLVTSSVIRTTEVPTTVTQKTTTVTTTAPKVSTIASAATKQLVITTTAPRTAATTSVTIITSTTPQTSAKAPLTTVSPATPVSGRTAAPTTATTTPQTLTSVRQPAIQQTPTSVKVTTTTSPTTLTITPQTIILAKAPTSIPTATVATTQAPVKPATSTTPTTPETPASPKAPTALATTPETQISTKAPTTQATTLQISTQQKNLAITTPTTTKPTTPVATSTPKIITTTTTTPSKTATQTETTTSKETPSKKLSAASKISSKNISKSPTPSQESPKDTKAKTRSRLSTAIRKLSKTNKKKDSPTHKPVSVEESKTTEAPLPESKTVPTAKSDSTEHITVESTKSTSAAVSAETKTTTEEDSKSKTKPRLTKRFILSSLRKSKTSAPKANDPPQADTIASKQKQGKVPATKKVITTIEKSKQETKIATDDTVAAPPTDRVRKVEITISGKKIEQTTGNGKHLSISSTTAIASSPSETDYLTPLEDSPKELSTAIVHETSIASSTTTTSPSKKKKLKSTKSHSSDSNKTTTTTAKQTTTTTTTSSTTQTLANIPAQIKSTEEKFVITQSIRDIPPSERAPAKPSRATPSSQTATTTGAVRKPSKTRSTATVVASRTIIQRLIKGSSAASSATNGKASKKKQQQQQQHTTTVAHSTQKVVETELMQTTQETLQRGHRFPTPSSPPSTLATVTTTSAPTTTATTSSSGKESPKQSSSPIASPSKIQCTPLSAVVADAVDVDAIAAAADTAKAHHSQRLIQLQLESNDSLSFSSSLPPTPPDEDPLSLKSNSSNEILKSYTSYISEGREEEEERNSSAYSATETRSPQHRYTSSHTAIALSEPEAVQLIAEESVLTVSTIGVDELASSAESAQLSDYCGNKIKGSNKTGYIQYSQDSQNIIQIPDISTASAPAPVHFAVGSAVRPPLTHFEQRSYDSNSSDSLSVVSEASRRRIHFLAQPTLSDEFESDELNRDLQKRFSEYSLESENDSIDKHMPAFGDLTMDQEVEPTIMTSSNTEKREHLYKILVIGELGTGKTSFIKRYVHQFFSQNYRATIGVDFALKVLNWDANTIVRLQLWDIAGQERFGNMTRVYYKEAVGAFIVFDVTRSGTFDCVSKWKEDLDSKVQLPDGSRIPCILLANKCDQEKQGIVTTPEKMDEYVRENGFVGWFETSAKENINIDEAAKALVNKILLNDKLITAADLADSDKFNLNNQGDQSGADSKTKCSC